MATAERGAAAEPHPVALEDARDVLERDVGLVHTSTPASTIERAHASYHRPARSRVLDRVPRRSVQGDEHVRAARPRDVDRQVVADAAVDEEPSPPRKGSNTPGVAVEARIARRAARAPGSPRRPSGLDAPVARVAPDERLELPGAKPSPVNAFQT
jgi:hypothetical protein